MCKQDLRQVNLDKLLLIGFKFQLSYYNDPTCLGLGIGAPLEANGIDVTAGTSMDSTQHSARGSLDDLSIAFFVSAWAELGTTVGEKGNGSHVWLAEQSETTATNSHLGRGDEFTGTQLESLGIVTSNTAALFLLSTVLHGNSMDMVSVRSHRDFINVHMIAVVKVLAAFPAKGRRLRKFGPFLFLLLLGLVIVATVIVRSVVVVLLFFGSSTRRRFAAGLGGRGLVGLGSWSRWGLQGWWGKPLLSL